MIAAVAISLIASFVFSAQKPEVGGGWVVIYSAPTLSGLAEEAANLYGRERVDVRFIGSVMGVRMILAGRTPDVFMSVDTELLKMIKPRSVMDLGSFKLHLVCRGNYTFSDIGRVRIGVANPNVAPIGYRALAALYWLSVKYNFTNLEEVSGNLKVNYSYDELAQKLVIDARSFEASGRYIARDDLAGVGALLEGGAVDCIFSHTPFIIARNYSGRFNVLELPSEISFLQDPPLNFTVNTELGEIDVKAFRAFAASFTSNGERYLGVMSRINLSKYGLMM